MAAKALMTSKAAKAAKVEAEVKTVVVTCRQ
jgi:hypothetical protein